MKIFFRTAGYILITAFASMMLLAFVAFIEYSLHPSQVQSCIKGKFVVFAPEDRGFIDIGEVEMCGTDLEISPVYGPNFEAHIEKLLQENAILRVQLDSCARKQAL